MSVWSRLRAFFRRLPDDDPSVALVLLLRQPRSLDTATLAGTIREAIGIDVWIGVDEPRGDYYVLEENGPTFIVQLGDRTFSIDNQPHTYAFSRGRTVPSIGEPRLRKLWAEHQAFLSVELRTTGNETPDAISSAYRTIGPLIAELADVDTLAIIEPNSGMMTAYRPSLGSELRGFDPLGALHGNLGTTSTPYPSDDLRFLAASEEARSRWPEFVTAFETRTHGQVFRVIVAVSEGDDRRLMRVTVTAIEGDYLYGTIDDAPAPAETRRRGARVRVPLSSLNDWAFTRGHTQVGNFTGTALRKSEEDR